MKTDKKNRKIYKNNFRSSVKFQNFTLPHQSYTLPTPNFTPLKNTPKTQFLKIN